jgi:hypothetical protein
VKNPSKTVVIIEVVLQSIGLSPLLLELSFTLIRLYIALTSSYKLFLPFFLMNVADQARDYSGREGSSDNNTTMYPKFLERLLQYTRILVVIAAILIIISASILNLSYLKAGATVLLATFVYVTCIAMLIVSRYRQRLVKTSQLGFWIAIASLPLYAVRVIYLMLVEFGNVKFDPVIGDWRYLAGLAFAMEVGIVIFLIVAGVTVEPLWVRSEFDGSVPIARSGKSAEVDVKGVPSVN